MARDLEQRRKEELPVAAADVLLEPKTPAEEVGVCCILLNPKCNRPQVCFVNAGISLKGVSGGLGSCLEYCWYICCYNVCLHALVGCSHYWVYGG